MALYPCDATNHRYVGAQQTIYPALANGTQSARRKLRLCPEHFEERVLDLAGSAHDAQIDPLVAAVPTCLSCSSVVADSSWAFFATVYANRAERADWWAPVHEACVAAVLRDWGLALASP